MSVTLILPEKPGHVKRRKLASENGDLLPFVRGHSRLSSGIKLGTLRAVCAASAQERQKSQGDECPKP